MGLFHKFDRRTAKEKAEERFQKFKGKQEGGKVSSLKEKLLGTPEERAERRAEKAEEKQVEKAAYREGKLEAIKKTAKAKAAAKYGPRKSGGRGGILGTVEKGLKAWHPDIEGISGFGGSGIDTSHIEGRSAGIDEREIERRLGFAGSHAGGGGWKGPAILDYLDGGGKGRKRQKDPFIDWEL